MSATGDVCIDCKTLRSKGDYSKTQWNKRKGTKKCKGCVDEHMSKSSRNSTETVVAAKLSGDQLFSDKNGKFRKCTVVFVNNDGTVVVDVLTEAGDGDEDGAELQEMQNCPQCQEQFRPIKCVKHPDTFTTHCLACKPQKERMQVNSDRLLPFNQELVGEMHNIRTQDLVGLGSKPVVVREDQSSLGEAIKEAMVCFSTAISKMNVKDSNTTRTLLDESRITKFKARFPRNEKEFYDYLNKIELFCTRNARIEPSTIFLKIVQSLNDHNTLQWNNFKKSVYYEHLKESQMNESDCDFQEFDPTLSTIDNFETFLVKHLQIHTDISFFKKQTSHIMYFKNENPAECIKRIETYLWQMDKVRVKLNSNSNGLPLRAMLATEKVDLIQRVFIDENNLSTLSNDGYLNGKVKREMSKKWPLIMHDATNRSGSSDDVDYEAMHKFALKFISEDLPNKVLPPMNTAMDTEGQHWELYADSRSIFQLKPVEPVQRGRKRPLKDALKGTKSKSEGRRPRKRQKSTENNNKHFDTMCKFGAECHSLRDKKQCSFRHLRSELIKAGVPRPKEQAKPVKQNENHSGKSENRGASKPCRRGAGCQHWQRGQCYFKHDDRKMRCGACGKNGHPTAKCHTKGGAGPTPPSYNPNHRMNHYGPQAHSYPLKNPSYAYPVKTDSVKSEQHDNTIEFYPDDVYANQKATVKAEKAKLDQMMMARQVHKNRAVTPGGNHVTFQCPQSGFTVPRNGTVFHG